MRNKFRPICLILIVCMLIGSLAACGDKDKEDGSTNSAIGGDDSTFGEQLDDLGVYDGYFEEETTESDLVITCLSGTAGAYSFTGGTLTFTAISEQTVYSISGKLKGNIVIDVGDDYKFDLEMHGFSMVSSDVNPITVLSGDEVSLTAKKDYENYIYDVRDAIDESDEALFSGAVHSAVDLEIAGKGSLTVISGNNNGIHSKDDLQVKNLTLFVACLDNALKGNDSVEIEGGELTLIASVGDGIKTTNSDVSEKGNQRGTVSITGGTHTIYAACDGIDAAYDVIIDDASTHINIYTDKYSNYSSEVTAVSEDVYYIRFTSKSYNFSIQYYNSDSDLEWVDATYHSSVSGGRSTYYYFSFPKRTEYSKMRFFIYSSGMETSQDEEYVTCSDYFTFNTSYDTIALSNSGYGFTNYTTTSGGGMGGFGGMGGMGGMSDGNSDKGDHSTKGIKASNSITINNGTLNIKSYDDALHSGNDEALENGESALGSVTVNGGSVSLYSNDDGLHADGILTVAGGSVSVLNSYEGAEGSQIYISGGSLSIKASDDGINSTATSGTGITIGDADVYIYCTGDGLDSNSRSSYQGISFEGGRVVVIANSSSNSAIDTEAGYKYTGGYVVAIMPTGGMASEATHCSNFSSVANYTRTSLSAGKYLVVDFGDTEAAIELPCSISAYVIAIGSKSASSDVKSSVSAELDANGVCWK